MELSTNTHDAARSEKPTNVRWTVMLFLCALSFLTYYDRVCIVRAQQDIQRDLHISDGQMGLIMGAFWLAYALFEIPGGWLGDRYGARGTLTRIVLAWSLFTALSGTATGFISLFAWRFLFGVGEAGAYPNMARVQAAWLPLRSRARWGGLLWLMARWGGAFSPVIFDGMLRAFGSDAFRSTFPWLAKFPAWRLGFIASGLVGVVWVVLFWPFFKDRPGDKRSVNRAELDLISAGKTGIDSMSHATPPGLWRSLFSSPSLWGIALLYLFGSFAWSFFVSWPSRFLKDVHGVTFEKSSLVSGLPLFFGGITCLIGGTLSDYLVRRTGRKRLFRALFPICGCLGAAAAILAMRYVQTKEQAVLCMCIAAAAYDFGQGANWATIVDIGGSYAGVATGFINMVGNMGNTLQPYIGQYLFNNFGWGALFAVYTCSYLIAGSMWLFINPERKFYREQSVVTS